MPAIIAVAPRVYRIPTVGDFINTMVFVELDGSVTLVDCGTRWAPPRIVKGLAAIGKHPRDVQKIVLTHGHNDHVGGAADMVRRTGVPGVAVHSDDVEYVETGTSPPMDHSTISGRLLSRTRYGGFAATPVAEQLTDGQLLPVGGGLRIHHTPGHTPGHISLLHEPTETLITGDAIWNMASRMSWPTKTFCASHVLNQRSAHVLGELEYQTVCFTHGPHISDGAREAVRGFLRRKDAWNE